MAKIKKADSAVWKIARRLSRRKGCNWLPLELLPDDTVKVYSIIRGNKWLLDLKTLKLLDNRK
jgi:hypothetical protein